MFLADDDRVALRAGHEDLVRNRYDLNGPLKSMSFDFVAERSRPKTIVATQGSQLPFVKQLARGRKSPESGSSNGLRIT